MCLNFAPGRGRELATPARPNLSLSIYIYIYIYIRIYVYIYIYIYISYL